jgi:NADH dehydrogenase FAD-containing subunit
VLLGRSAEEDGEAGIDYDALVVAAGARHASSGHDEWEALAPGLKTLEDATEIRARILTAPRWPRSSQIPTAGERG